MLNAPRLVLTTSILLLLRVAAAGTTAGAKFTSAPPEPEVLYPLTLPVTPSGFGDCYVQDNPSLEKRALAAVFSVYVCYNSTNGAQRSFLGYTDLATPSKSKVLVESSASNSGSSLNTFATPIPINHYTTLFWAAGGESQYEIGVVNIDQGDSTPNSSIVWKEQVSSFTVKPPAYSISNGNVYYVDNTSVVARRLTDGKLIWVQTMNGRAGVTHISSPIYFEDYVYWLTNYGDNSTTISKKFAGASNSMKVQDPCGITAVPGHLLHLDLVQYGEDQSGGALNGIFIYGNHQEFGTSFKSFLVCRISRQNLTSEMVWNFQQTFTVNGVTGGVGAVYCNVFNKETATSQVLIINQSLSSGGTFVINRTANDLTNNPMVMYAPPTYDSSPLLILQKDGETVAYELQPLGGGGKFPEVIAWKLSRGCAMPGTIASSADRFFCIWREENTLWSANFAGEVVWSQLVGNSTLIDPFVINVADVYVLFQKNFGVIGYSFDPRFTLPPITPRPPTAAPPHSPSPTSSPRSNTCGQFSNGGCVKCTNAPQGNCGFCFHTKTCQQGTSNGPVHGSGCPVSSWEWYPDQCEDNDEY